MQNKRVLISGASRGIGRATALLLAQLGAKVFACARNIAELDSLEKESDFNISTQATDVTQAAEMEALFSSVHQKMEGLDILICNAGIGKFGATTSISIQDWEEVMAVNVKGTFLMCQQAIPLFKAQGSGHIVIVASDVAKRSFDGGSLYCASKYAQEGFASALRKELRPFGIKVSVVYSGLVDTYFHSDAQGESHKATWLQEKDMAEALFYICNQPAHVVIDELMIHPLSQDY